MFEWMTQMRQPKQRASMVQRGYSIYHISQLYPITGEDKHGNMVTASFEFPWFTLSPVERIDISKKSSWIYGMVTGRMNRISSLPFNIVPDHQELDRNASQLKMLYTTYKDFLGSGEQDYIMAAGLLRRELQRTLFDLVPNMSNFSQCMVRWAKRVKAKDATMCNEIEDFISRPNKKDQWEDIVKKWVYDLMIHGALNLYKKRDESDEIQTLHALPGGSIYPLRTKYVSNFDLFAQVVPGEPTQVFDLTELIRDVYAPTSYNEYGIVPLDSVVNKISEQLLSEAYWAKQADGTQPAEKLIAMEEKAVLPGVPSLPLDPKEQKRIETALNQHRRGAIRTISGTGPITLLDISKNDMLDGQLKRLAEIKKDFAQMWNMTQMEINESDGGKLGSTTAESEERIEKQKGSYPIIHSIEGKINYELIRDKWGTNCGCSLSMLQASDEREQIELIKLKLESGAYGTNEVRTEDLGKEEFDDPKYNFPPDNQPQVEQAINGLVQNSFMRHKQSPVPVAAMPDGVAQ